MDKLFIILKYITKNNLYFNFYIIILFILILFILLIVNNIYFLYIDNKIYQYIKM